MQTYFAFLATLLMLLAAGVLLLVAILAFGADWHVFFLLVPAGVAVYFISLVVGYFLSEPIRKLDASARSMLEKGGAFVPPDTSQLYEADSLAQSFKKLSTTVQEQKDNLNFKEKRQVAFVSDVAHELRTPLTAIHGNAEMLADPDLPPELHDKFVNIVIKESERLGRLTNDLLTLQRIEDDTMPYELQRINLKNLAREVLDALDPMLREREANTAIIGEAPDVLGNPDRLKQVVSNLVDNASRFIDPGGHVTIEMFGLKGNSIIAVKDDGAGFGDIDPKLLFDRFYRADSSRSRGTGGTGLGLAIVKSVVEAHEGTVEAINLPHGGACFIVALPSIPVE